MADDSVPLDDEFEVGVEDRVGFGSPAIAGGQGDSVLGRSGGDQSVVHGAASDAECRQPGMKSLGTAGAEKARAGEVVGEQPGDGARGTAIRS